MGGAIVAATGRGVAACLLLQPEPRQDGLFVRIGGVAQTVAEEVEGEHDQHYRHDRQ